MLVNQKLVFVTPPKTAWTFTREYLRRMFPHSHYVRKYVKDLDIRDFQKFKFANVRNPWDYYVSWYHFHHSKKTVWFKCLLENLQPTFENFIKRIGDYRGSKLSDVKTIEWDLDKHLLQKGFVIQEQPVGLYTLLHFAFLSKHSKTLLIDQPYSYTQLLSSKNKHINVDFLCRMEHLRTDLVEVMKLVGQPLNRTQVQHLQTTEKKNTTKHKDYREYYSDETRELVAELDKYLITQYRYRFDE